MPAVPPPRALAWLLVLAAVCRPSTAGADSVLLKDGTTYRGTIEKDNTVVFVNDFLKRVIFYNSKIKKEISDPGFSKLERFALDQPLEVHAGVQPTAAVDIRATPWDNKGRRKFRYVNNRQRVVEMRQAINELGPYLTRYRGIDGFWVGMVATSQVPRPVVVDLLGRVEQGNEKERLKVARWLLQAEWYPEARVALDGLDRDFPHLKENVADVRRTIAELEAREALKEADIRRRGNQPAGALAILRALPTSDLPRDILDDVRDQLRKADDQAAADRGLADALRDLAEKLPEADRKAWKARLGEVLEGLATVPDVARARVGSLSGTDPFAGDQAPFARAMSGWVVGPDAAAFGLSAAGEQWKARDLALGYLGARDESARQARLADLQALDGIGPDAVARVVAQMAPPLAEKDPDAHKPGQVKIHRVAGDDNPEPTEYSVLLPPEYHPLRSYPAVVALHDGRGPKSAVDWVAAEAARRGYIVIAPEYQEAGKTKGFHYATGEHAAVILALRDARKRYAIDSDRVHLAGQLVGGDMAWDLGLAHPDLFAGVVVISGFPANYAYKYKPQVAHLPFYVALGELAPAAREVVFEQYVRPMIEDVKDVTYVDYFKRGREELPEEVPAFFDWMDRRHRDPAPKTFEAATAREGDDRFFGVIVRDFAPGRATAPEAADPLGQNLRPATIKMRTSTTGNLINLTTTGINRLDFWVSPRLIDFRKKFTVRLNDKPLFSGLVKPDLAPMLEDLRVRGDRQQLYFFKVTMGMQSKPKGR